MTVAYPCGVRQLGGRGPGAAQGSREPRRLTLVTTSLPQPRRGAPLVSVSLRDATGGAVLAAEDADRVHDAAAVGAIVLLAEVAVRFVDGRLSRDEPLVRTSDDAASGPGLWQQLRADTLPAADLAALVGATDDVLATNVLLRRVGMAAVSDRARTMGLSDTALLDRVRDVRRPSDAPAHSVGTATELSGVMLALHHGQVRSRAVSHQVLDWLGLHTDTSMVAGALGMDPLAHADPDRGLTLAHRTGTGPGIRADVGLATGPRGAVAYAVLATFDDGDRDGVLASMFRVGERVRRFIDG